MVNSLKPECSFTSWYPLFSKDSLRATIIHIPDEVLKYLEHDAFVLPVEATDSTLQNTEWMDGSPVVNDEVGLKCVHKKKQSEIILFQHSLEVQPTFPQFSQQIQDVINEYGAVFIKSNWSSPLVCKNFGFYRKIFNLTEKYFQDATWVAPTKTLKCKTLEEVYLLLKSSDRIAKDLNNTKNYINHETPIKSSLILKQWKDINPCTEFRCFVIQNELIGNKFQFSIFMFYVT